MGTILRGVAGFGFDASLFLMNCSFIHVFDLTPFYQGLFRALTPFKWDRLEPTASLFWLLEEPLIHGAWLDVQTGSHPAFAFSRDSEAETHSGCSGSRTSQHRGSGFSTESDVKLSYQRHFKHMDEKAE